jgi:hypothetical protein
MVQALLLLLLLLLLVVLLLLLRELLLLLSSLLFTLPGRPEGSGRRTAAGWGAAGSRSASHTSVTQAGGLCCHLPGG